MYFTTTLSAQQPLFPTLTGNELLEAVQDAYTPASVLPFNESRDSLFGSVYKTNDSLYCVYTGWPVYLAPNEDPTQAAYQGGQGINTEHAWPQTFGAGIEPARADMHHLFPTRADVNGARGNLPFGDINDSQTDRWYFMNNELSNPPSNNRDSYSEYFQNIAFEPREDFKGNIARAMMYFYTIYRSRAEAEGPNFFSAQRETFCDWHALDPVDELEWVRTFRIANFQDGKANPFILDCTLAERLYCPNLVVDNCFTSATQQPGTLPLAASVAPNPLPDGHGQLKITCLAAGDLTVNYTDALGRRVQQEKLYIGAGEQQLSLQLPHSGMWFLDVQLDAGGERYSVVLKVMEM